MLQKNPELTIPLNNPFQNDQLERNKVADNLTLLVQSTNQPFVISIQAPSGWGKSTFIKMWKAQLEQSGHICFYFNAWENDFVDDPLIAFIGEDNTVNQKLSLRLLEQMGYRADVASNGLEAIEAVDRQTYDVILMDVQMPEMDGLEATRQIVARWPEQHPYIVGLTANAMQGDREMCLNAGMDNYIAKPIRVIELVDALFKANRTS